ncbi:hypothetical protein GCM10023323_68260 [Streptomyces thinghirensis]|uniref:Uncharacterized protein n=1 Tax=Streptomyces thinghirensis TaxID=551547 RepID=A0ABP9TFA4_9ACTN
MPAGCQAENGFFCGSRALVCSRRPPSGGEEDFGAFNPYARRPGAFAEDLETAGWMLASYAVVALASVRTIDQLEHAMETRLAIGEAWASSWNATA